jgi:flagellar hook-length control protein FliK
LKILNFDLGLIPASCGSNDRSFNMAVSPLLNDLALAAATARTDASRKAAQKGSDANFSSALAETRQENFIADKSSKRPPQARVQAKHDPRDHRSSEARQAHAERQNLREAKAHARHDHGRRDQDLRESNAVDEHVRAAAPPQSNETATPREQSSEPGSEIKQTDSLKQSTNDGTVQTETAPIEPNEAIALDASTVIQTATPQPLQTAAIPVDVQIASFTAGAAHAVEAEAAKRADETLVDNTAAITADQSATNADIPVANPHQTAVQTQSAAKTADSHIAQQATLDSTAEITAVSSQVKSAPSFKNEQVETKAYLDVLEGNQPQAKSAVGDRGFFVSEQASAKQAFNDILVATNSHKTTEGTTGLSAVIGNGGADASQAIKTPASSPSDGLSRADAPVPLQAVAVEIGMRAMRGSKEFSIRLDPEDLGRIDIKLEISEAGEVQAKLMVDRVETLQLLQRDAKTLERAFDQAGLKSNPDGLQFSLRDPGQQRDGQNNQQSERTKLNSSDKDILGIEETPAMRAFRYTSPATSGLDIRI